MGKEMKGLGMSDYICAAALVTCSICVRNQNKKIPHLL